MKNNLFRKFLALFLTGTMLTGVGCKDYDDDIDNINKRLDGMDVTVADLQTQITNVKNAIPSLDELNKKVATLTEGLDGVQSSIVSINKEIDAVKKAQQALANLKSELEAYVRSQIQSSETTLRNELATKEAVSKIEQTIAALKTSVESELKKINEAIAKLEGVSTPDYSGDIQSLKERLDKLDGANGDVKALKDRLAELEKINHITKENLAEEINKLTTAPSWLGDAITAAIEAYQFPYATAAEATDATIKSLLEKMGYANKDYKESLIDLIQKNSFSSADLEEAITNYESTVKPLIAALENRVFELEARIQSMVFVPSSLAEANEGILFEASQFIVLKNAKNEEKSIALGTQKAPVATIKMRVSPAAAVAKIRDAYNNDKKVVKIVAEPIKVTRAAAAAPSFEVTAVAFDVEKGTFTVTATTDYKFGAVENETLAIAVNVSIPNANKVGEGETATSAQGIDYTSAFIGCVYNEKGLLTAEDFVVAYKNDEGELTVYDGSTAYTTELEYNKEGQKVTFFDGFAVYYKTGNDAVPYAALDTMWNGQLASKLVVPDAKEGIAEVNPKTNEKSYELKNVSAMILSGKSTTDLIGDRITSDKFSFILGEKAETAYTLPILGGDYVQHVIDITAVNTDLKAPAQSFAWKYGTINYEAKNIVVSGQISANAYTELKDLTPVSIEVLGKKDGKDVAIADLKPTISYPSTPGEDGDSQKADLTIEDRADVMIADGAYTVKAKYVLADQTSITTLIPFTVTGMPELEDFAILAKVITYNGELTYTILEPTDKQAAEGKDVANLIWNKYSTVLKDCFTEATFVDMLKAATVKQDNVVDKETQKVLAKLSNDFAAVKVTFDNAAEATYTPGLTYTNGKIVVKLTSSVTMKQPVVELLKNTSYFEDGMAVPSTTLTQDGYKVESKALSGAYSKSEGTPKNAEIKYYLGYTTKELEAMEAQLKKDLGQENVTMPQIQNNILDWGDWNKLTLKLVAKIELNGAVLGEPVEFTAKIADPIKDNAITQKKTDKGKVVEAVIYEKAIPAELSIPEYLVLNTINDENVFAADKAQISTVLKGEPAYELDTVEGVSKDLITVDEKTGLVTFNGSGFDLRSDVIVKVKVSYTYLYGTKTMPNGITITIKPGEEK